jgi:hypothetical protein
VFGFSSLSRQKSCMLSCKASEAVQVLKFTTSSQQVSIHVTKFHTTIVKYHHSKMSMHYAWLITQFIHQFFILVTVEAYDENWLLPGAVPIQSTVVFSRLRLGRPYVKRVSTKRKRVIPGATRISCLSLVSRRWRGTDFAFVQMQRADAVQQELPDKN